MSHIAENLAFLLNAGPAISPVEEVGILLFFVPAVSIWIDRNRIAGSDENTRIVRALHAMYTRKITWSELQQRSALRDLTVRLRNLIS
jgi:hypothetical protein